MKSVRPTESRDWVKDSTSSIVILLNLPELIYLFFQIFVTNMYEKLQCFYSVLTLRYTTCAITHHHCALVVWLFTCLGYNQPGHQYSGPSLERPPYVTD